MLFLSCLLSQAWELMQCSQLPPWAHWAGDMLPLMFCGGLDVLSIAHLELDRKVGGGVRAGGPKALRSGVTPAFTLTLRLPSVPGSLHCHQAISLVSTLLPYFALL